MKAEQADEKRFPKAEMIVFSQFNKGNSTDRLTRGFTKAQSTSILSYVIPFFLQGGGAT